jgi:hypothetical protein
MHVAMIHRSSYPPQQRAAATTIASNRGGVGLQKSGEASLSKGVNCEGVVLRNGHLCNICCYNYLKVKSRRGRGWQTVVASELVRCTSPFLHCSKPQQIYPLTHIDAREETCMQMCHEHAMILSIVYDFVFFCRDRQATRSYYIVFISMTAEMEIVF